MVLTETWLHDAILDNDLGLFNYNIYRCDRSCSSSIYKRGGGVLISIRKDIKSQLIPFIDVNVEHLFVIYEFNDSKFIIGGVYLPPNCSVSLFESYMSTIERIAINYSNYTFIICGDFNLPGISWSNDVNGLVYSSTLDNKIDCVPETFAALNFFQVNHLTNSHGSMLNLVFVSANQFNVNIVCDPVIINHAIIKLPVFNSSHSYHNFVKADYFHISQFLLSFNWKTTFSFLDVNSAVYTFYDAIHYSLLNYVPIVNFNTSNFPSWFSKDLIDLVFQKRKAHASFKATKKPDDYDKFSFLRSKYKLLSRICYKQYIEYAENNICSDPKEFWNFVRKNKSSHNLPKSVSLNGVFSNNDKDVADLFSKLFDSVYTLTNVTNNSYTSPHLPFDLPSNCNFNVNDVEASLAKLRGVKSVGPDGLSGDFLFTLKSVLCYPLWLLFRKSLDSGVFPEYLKLNAVIPIFKNGDTSDVVNYRPIAILSHIGKLFESLVFNSIQRATNATLIDEQHGFRPGRSAVTCNLVFSNYIFSAFNMNSQVDVVYTDFAKAFDRVEHSILGKVLENSGFGEPLLSWFNSYLSNRKQFVKVFEIKSDITNVPSGVPQGGHLSPMLFALFINNIKHVIHNSKFLLFADDLKLFLKIDLINDCLLLQEDINAVVNWATNMGLEFNVVKCHSMSFYRTRTPITFTYFMNDFPLIHSDNTVTDLGIVFDRELNFHSHIENSCCKALKILGFLRRICSEFKLMTPLKLLYCAYVRSVLESYGIHTR
uniref:RNA-directed DNA polymerase from mobile element jockey n=1 Tax=Sipha flava TaxID=143950 RepID=A0A2S2R2Y8_9HEMI